MPLQSNFALAIPVGYPGQIANGELQNRITRTCEDVAGIAFGRAVFQGTGDHGCTATPSAALSLGVAIVDHGNVRKSGDTADVYARYENVPIMERGVVWVLNGAAPVVRNESVYVTPAGAYTNVASGNVQLDGWKFQHSAAAGAMVRINKNR